MVNNLAYRLKAKNLHFSYIKGQEVIHDVSLMIPDGKITGVIGGNGCGKSTLFHLLAGRLKPISGEIILDNENIRTIKRKSFAKTIAAVYQNNTAPSDITVRKLVELGRTPYKSLLAYGNNGELDLAAVDNALRLTDTEKYADRMISQLSGGQRQRVWLAMALAQTAPILFLDEITTFLDIKYQLQILNLIRRLNKEQGMTILMILHDINQTLEFCDEVIAMEDGRIVVQGDKYEVITESMLERVFRIKADIRNIDNKKYCIFQDAKGELYHADSKK